MRLDPTKAFPHPVLRPATREQDADFPGHDIQTILDVEANPDDASIQVSVEFMLQQPDLINLIKDGFANYGCLIWCQSTLHRDLVLSSDPSFSQEYKYGVLSDIVELRPLVVAVQDINGFRSDSWNPEFEGYSFNIGAGSVLAQDEAIQFPATQEFLKPVTSVFDVIADPELEQGAFDVTFDNRVRILMNPKDRDIFLVARMNRNHRGNILAGILMPVVIASLTELTKLDSDERQDDEWGRAFEFALNRIKVDVDEIKEGRLSTISVAQRLLNQPLRTMAFMLEDSL